MRSDVRPIVKIFLADPGGKREPFCGPGMIKLLLSIKKSGNVRQACELMEMSYSKGWKLLKGLETWLGYPVVIRQQGGEGGGKAHLTNDGEAFLERYQLFFQECQQKVQDIFEHYYGRGMLI